jgi:hypothetical protein
MSRPLKLKPKNRLRVKTSVKLVIAGAGLCLLLTAGWLFYYNFGKQTITWGSGESRFSGFNWRKKITLNKTIFSGIETLINFPLLVSLKDPDLRHINRGGKMIHLKGNDIRFSKMDGETPLLSQVESYNPETGELLAWVLIDTLKPFNENLLYIYFSRAEISGLMPDLIWENDYQAIWHFNTGLHADNSRKIRATAIGTSSCNGKIANGRMFNALSEECAYYPWAQDLDLKSDISISAWVYPIQKGREQVIVSNQGDHAGGYRLYLDKQNKVAFDFISADGVRHGPGDASGGTPLSTGEWYYVSAVYSLTEHSIQTYLNGVPDRIYISTQSPAPTPSPLQIGRDLFNVQSYFSGALDELRISNKPKSAQWIAFEYLNQKSSLASFRVGMAEELRMSAVHIKANKMAMQQTAAQTLEQNQRENTLQQKKLPVSANNPAVPSESADVIRARLENIRRVSQENSRSK